MTYIGLFVREDKSIATLDVPMVDGEKREERILRLVKAGENFKRQKPGRKGWEFMVIRQEEVPNAKFDLLEWDGRKVVISKTRKFQDFSGMKTDLMSLDLASILLPDDEWIIAIIACNNFSRRILKGLFAKTTNPLLKGILDENGFG